MPQAENFKQATSTNEEKGTHQVFKDPATVAKVRKHISDINDQITDEDILNIKTEMTTATEPEFKSQARSSGFSERELDALKNAGR